MTILFSISNPKIPKLCIFGPKFKDFYFYTKLCNKTNSIMLISNKTIAFSNFNPKTPKSGIFGPEFKDFYFCTNIWNKADLMVLISNMTMVFQIWCPKHANKAFLVQNLRIFTLAINFAFWKIRGYFRYDNSFFFKFQPKNTQIWQFWF